MKIAFSTLGCPDFDWPDIYSMAKDLGFDGIEMRGLGDDLFAVNARPFRADHCVIIFSCPGPIPTT